MSFPDAARVALGDSQLRRNLGHATRTIREKRAGVVAELPDWEELRVAGERIKDGVLHRLDELLDELEERVTGAGGAVHWARDAEEANRVVTGLVFTCFGSQVLSVRLGTISTPGRCRKASISGRRLS